jgi:hypothetical protein
VKDFVQIVVIFEEEIASKDPYFMGITHKGDRFVVKGKFLDTSLDFVGQDFDLDWGVINLRSKFLCDQVLEDCFGESHPKIAELSGTLKYATQGFPRDEGTSWLLWRDDLLKWCNLPRYGIIPRIGYTLYQPEDKTLLIRFPVPGVTYNQVGRG